jgi:hypothetical protein
MLNADPMHEHVEMLANVELGYYTFSSGASLRQAGTSGTGSYGILAMHLNC